MPLDNHARVIARLMKLTDEMFAIVERDDTILWSSERLELYRQWVKDAVEFMKTSATDIANKQVWMDAAHCIARGTYVPTPIQAKLQELGETSLIMAIRDLINERDEQRARAEEYERLATATILWYQAEQKQSPNQMKRLATGLSMASQRFRELESAVAAHLIAGTKDDNDEQS